MPLTPKNKILLFSSQWPEYMIELANAMAEKGNVYLMLPTNHRFSKRHRELISKKVNFISYQTITHKSRIVGIKLALRILFEIWKIRPTILHIQSNGGYAFLWVLKYLPKVTKVVNTVHDPVLHLGDFASQKSFNQQVIDNAIRHTNKYIVHGEFLKSELAESYKVPVEIIHAVPHGHFEIYKKFGPKSIPKEEKKTVLFFGRIWKYKGLQCYIDAANKVIDKIPDATFYIVGTGDDIRNYKFDNKKMDNFKIVNKRVTIEEATYYYSKAAFVVLPYIEATQSGIIPVAYAFGKPVIATRVGAIPEVVIDNETGFLVDPENITALSEKMEFLLSNNDQRKYMGERAYEFAMKDLSWDYIATKTLAVYDQC